ncbi:MAG: DUF2721 domain-containing protein [Thermoanaerobaculia bacterium]
MPALPSEVLGGMITPALLISACGTLVLSTSNRLSRVVDRVRVLTAEVERSRSCSSEPGSQRRTALISQQLEHLTRRALILRASMTALYVSIVLLIATSLSVGLAVLLGWRYGLSIAFALAGASALLYGSILLIREARVAVVSTLQEMAYARELVASPPSRPEA